MNQIIEEIDFKGKKIIDIGGGRKSNITKFLRV